MSFWQAFAVAYVVVLALILLWNHGAHRKGKIVPFPERGRG